MPLAAILTALQVEYLAVQSHLSNLQEEIHRSGTIYERGNFSANEQEWEVVIALVGQGNDNAQGETQQAINHFNPDILFFIGVAGGVKDVNIGDVVAGTKIYNYESGKVEKQFSSRPETKECAYSLVQRAKAEARKSDWLKRLSYTPNSSPSVKIAPIASGEKIIASTQSQVFELLRDQYNDAIAVEKEGFGFLSAAFRNNNIQAIVIRGISDLIDGKNDNSIESEEIRQEKASHHASAFAFEILAKYKINDLNTTKDIREINTSNVASNELFTDTLLQRNEAVILKESDGVNDERHDQITQVQNFFDRNEFRQAVQYLEDLRKRFWHKADDKIKYRLLANIGLSKLGLYEIDSAANFFLEALQYNSEDDKALANAAMGYFFQRDDKNTEGFINKALQKNPANILAYSLRIRIAPVTESIEVLLEKIPVTYHKDPEILVALGVVCLERHLYGLAKDCWQEAIDKTEGKGLDGIKVALGTALIEPLTKDYPLIMFGQLPDDQKQDLETAISLFTEVIGDYPNPNHLSSLQFTALTNRLSALRLLKRYDEAIRDVKIALCKEPKNSYLIKQCAIINHDGGNEEEAYQYLRQFLSSFEVPEAHLLAAATLMTLKRFNEAETVLEKILEADISNDFKQNAKHLKVDLLIKHEDYQTADKLLQEISDENPEDIFTIIQRIRLSKLNGSEQNISALIEQAKLGLLSATILDKIYFADFLHSWQYFRDAAEIYEQFVDKTLNNDLSFRLLESYYFSGNYRDTLDLCEQLLHKYGPLPNISEVAAYIYDYMGNLPAAREVCENHLKNYPDDDVIKLRLAAVNYATQEYEKLDQFLDSEPSIENLNIESCKKLAQLYKVRNRIDSFINLIYEMRHRFYSDTHVHVLYQIGYLEATNIKQDTPTLEIVQDGCGVLVKNGLDRESWYILEDRPDSNSDRFELNAKQDLYKSLIGKKCGDEIIQTEDSFGRNALTIIAITDKYFAAGQQSFSLLENQLDIKGFRMFTVSMDGDNLSPDWVKQFIKGLQELEKNFEELKSHYISGKFPFGSFATFLNRNPIELWQILSFGVSPFIHSWSNFNHEKFEDALTTLQKGGLIVIDPISLITLHNLDVADNVVRILGNFGIAQSTIDLFQSMIETTQGLESKGYATIGTVEGQGIFHEISPEQVIQNRNFFEKIINWISDNCHVLPCNKALDINHSERTKFNEHIGTAFIDTVLIAGEPGRILYSDDQWLRYYARSDSNVQGVWTQAILKYCFTEQNINESLYHKTTLQLAHQGYTYTIINADTLMEAVRLNWKLQPVFTSALKALAHQNTSFKYLISVATNFFYKLYLEVKITDNQIIDPCDAFVFNVLKILTEKRSITHFTHHLKNGIRQKFRVIPLQEEKVLQVIDIWIEYQSVIT